MKTWRAEIKIHVPKQNKDGTFATCVEMLKFIWWNSEGFVEKGISRPEISELDKVCLCE